MVRLKEDAKRIIEFDRINFNSTMVRLKAAAANGLFLPAKFQFHYGTIKSQELATVRRTGGDFNSTMVRLKGVYGDAWVYGDAISIPLWYD